MAPPRRRVLPARPLAVLLGLLLVAFGLRVAGLETQSIWVDEGFSVDFATLSASEMTAMWKARGGVGDVSNPAVAKVANDPLAIAVDIHPPLYYLTLHEWIDAAGRTEYAVRFPSVIAGMLLVLALYSLGTRLAGTTVGLASAAVGVATPFYVAYSQEARMYAPVAAFCAFSLYFTWRLLSRRGPPQRRTALLWLGLIVSDGLAVYTHYSAALPLVAENLIVAGFVLARHDRRAWRLAGVWAASQLAVLLLFLPWLRTSLGQVAKYNENLWVPNWRLELTDTFRAFASGTWLPTAEGQRLTLVACAVFLIGLAACMWMRRSNRLPRPAIVFAVGALGLELGLALAVFQVRPEFSPRYLMVLATPFYLLLGLGLVALWRRWRPAGVLAGAALAAVFVVGLWGYEFDPNFAKDDTRTLAQYLSSTTTASDVIVVDAPEPLRYYYHGPADVKYIPGDQAQELTSVAAGKKRVILVQWFLSTSDPQQLVYYLLQKYGKLTADKAFRGYWARTYELPSTNTTFTLDAPSQPANANFDHILALDGAAVSPSLAGDPALQPRLGQPVAASGQDLMVAMRWKLLQPTSAIYRASAYLTDDQGHLGGQADITLYDGQATTARWTPGDEATDYFVLPTIGGLMPGKYTLNVAVYPDGQQGRLSVLDAAGAPGGGSLALGPVTILPPLSPTAASTASKGQVAPGVDLVGSDLPASPVSQGDPLHLTLFWQATAQPPANLQTTIALVPSGQAADVSAWQWSAAPRFPTQEWQAGDAFRDWYDPLLPPKLAPGAYQVLVGMGHAQVPIGQVQVLQRTRDFSQPAPNHPLPAQIGDAIRLLGYDLDQTSHAPGSAVHLTMYWQATAAMDVSYTAFVHLLDSGRHVVSQVDAIPNGGQLPTTAWLPGEVVPDAYRLPLKADLPAGSYTLEVGFYRADTLVRLHATSAAATVKDDGIEIGSITVAK